MEKKLIQKKKKQKKETREMKEDKRLMTQRNSWMTSQRLDDVLEAFEAVTMTTEESTINLM